MRFNCAAVDCNLLDAEIVKGGLIAVGLLVQRHADLVNDLVAALFLDR